ncbi:hypothetical protein ACHQM5_017914 [Ranunculus cassubicifolius]
MPFFEMCASCMPLSACIVPDARYLNDDHVLIERMEMDSLDNLTPEQYAALYNEDFQYTFGTFSDTKKVSQIFDERPAKQLKGSVTSDSWKSDITGQRSSPELPLMACYGNRVSSPNPKSSGKNKKAGKPSAKPPGTLEHMIAERKRREKLSQQFIALSALVPGLKKMDKTSVLAACMQHVKHLQTRVQELEEQTSKKTIESAVFVKKFQVSSDTDSCSTGQSSSNFSIEQLPEIEARMSDRNVLMRIYCEKRRGAMAQILLETEKLNLNVMSSSVLPFGCVGETRGLLGSLRNRDHTLTSSLSDETLLDETLSSTPQAKRCTCLADNPGSPEGMTFTCITPLLRRDGRHKQQTTITAICNLLTTKASKEHKAYTWFLTKLGSTSTGRDFSNPLSRNEEQEWKHSPCFSLLQ